MTRKLWLWLAAAALLGGWSLYLNRDWFAKDTIQIYDRSRPARALFFGRRRASTSATDPITFGFSRRLKLKSVKVIPVTDISTNRYPHPIWYLLSDSNSLPVKDFFYGGNIPGMRPAVKGAVPDPLEPGTVYRLYVEAGDFKGEHDFTAVARHP